MFVSDREVERRGEETYDALALAGCDAQSRGDDDDQCGEALTNGVENDLVEEPENGIAGWKDEQEGTAHEQRVCDDDWALLEEGDAAAATDGGAGLLVAAAGGGVGEFELRDARSACCARQIHREDALRPMLRDAGVQIVRFQSSRRAEAPDHGC
jgi:hypothetical protein